MHTLHLMKKISQLLYYCETACLREPCVACHVNDYCVCMALGNCGHPQIWLVLAATRDV